MAAKILKQAGQSKFDLNIKNSFTTYFLSNRKPLTWVTYDNTAQEVEATMIIVKAYVCHFLTGGAQTH